MDNITQWVIWWSIYTLITGKHQAKHMRLWALITNIPDLDVFVARWVTTDPISQMFFHRGIIHSLIFNAILALLIWYILYRSDSQISYIRYSMACFISILCGHLLIDGLTSYGMRYFLPWDSTVYSRDTLFIVDFVVWLITIGWLIAYHIWSSIRKWIASVILILMGIYIGLAIGIKSYLSTHMQTDFVQTYPTKQIVSHHMFAEPLQIMLWRQIIQTEDGYYEWYRSVRDDIGYKTTWRYIQQNKTWVRLISSLIWQDTILARDLRHVLNFTRWYYHVTQTASGYRIDNLVFWPINGRESNPQRMFAFALQQSVDWYQIVMDRNFRSRSVSWDMRYRFRDRVWSRG